MSLKDALTSLETAQKNVGGKQCRVAEILAQLDPTDAAALNRLIDHTQVYGTQIADVVTKAGHRISGGNIQHHRRRTKGGGCICPPPNAAT